MYMKEAATLAGISVQTLRRWLCDGIIPDDYRRVVHGQFEWRVFSEEDVAILRRFVLLNKGKHIKGGYGGSDE